MTSATIGIAGRLWTGAAPSSAPAVIEDGVVTWDDTGRITYAGAVRDAGRIAGIVEDSRGRFVMPGLIDCHVHLCHDGVADIVAEASDSPGLAAVKALVNAQRALAAGVTTVRDLGAKDHSVIGVAQAVAEGVVMGPRILAAGRLLTMTGGHGSFLGREVDGPDAMRAAVREELKAGATVIKVVATGGVLTPRISAQQQAYTSDELAAAVDAAHMGGVPCTAHAIGTSGIKAALAAGVDSIEHGCFLDDEAIGMFVSSGATLVATISAPVCIVAGEEHGVPAYAVAKGREVAVAHRSSFQRAVEAGVSIACGTDAGTPFNFHGSTAREVGLMVSYGQDPAAALVAATRTGAELLRVDSETGTLEAGKFADVLVVDGDPLADVAALLEPWRVYRAGADVTVPALSG